MHYLTELSATEPLRLDVECSEAPDCPPVPLGMWVLLYSKGPGSRFVAAPRIPLRLQIFDDFLTSLWYAIFLDFRANLTPAYLPTGECSNALSVPLVLLGCCVNCF